MQFEAVELQSHLTQNNLLNYQMVSNSHYHEGPDWLTESNLKNLAEAAEKIDEPIVLGEFNSHQHYLETLHLVLGSTHETRNRILFLLNEVLPTLSTKESLLDIGPGDGAITKTLAPYFKTLTAIDLNERILNSLALLLPKNVHYVRTQSCISKVKLELNYYDLCLLSHMLYYVEQSSWLDIVKSTYYSLKTNGVLVIALGGDEFGKKNLIQRFGGRILPIDWLALQCKNTFEDVKLFASDEEFVGVTEKAMFHIAAFMLGDAQVTAEKNDLIEYINTNLQCSDEQFKMTTRQKYIVIKKITKPWI